MIKKVLALGIFAVVGTVGVLGASAYTNHTASIEALKSGNIANYKAETIKERTAELTAKINSMTDAEFKELQTKAPEMEAMNTARLEFVAKATEFVKANNKDGFKTLVKENKAKMETLRKNDHKGKNSRPEMTDAELETMYQQAVESVKNGTELNLRPAHKNGEGRKGRGGDMMKF